MTPSIVPSHLRSLRRSWLYLLVVVVGMWGIVEGARTLARMRDARLPGAAFSRRLLVTAPVHDDRLAIGDRIVARNGVAIDDADQLRLSPDTHRVTVTIDRAGSRRDVTVDTFAPDLVAGGVRYASGSLFVLIGLVVFWFHPGRRESWPFLFGCVAYGIALLCTFGVPRTTQSLFDARVGLFADATIGFSFVQFFMVFPRPLRVIVRRPRLPRILNALGVVLGAVTAAVLPRDPATSIMVAGVAIANAAASACALAMLIWRFRRPLPRDDRTRLRALVLASVLALALPALASLGVALGWWQPRGDTNGWAIAALPLAFPIIVGFALVRRDLFAIDRAVARTAAASAVVGIVALVFVAAAVLLPSLVAPRSPTIAALVAIGGIALTWPLQRRVQQRLLSRFVAAGIADRLGDVRDALASLAEEPEPARFSRVERRLESALEVANAALLVRDGQGWHRPATAEVVEPSHWPRIVELSLDAAIGTGELAKPATHALAALAQDVVRAVGGNHRGDRIGDYRIERVLATGGMGIVYVAAKIGVAGFVKPVAIKQLLPEMAIDPAAVERFLDEARLVARLAHPGIVQTLELGEAAGRYFIVMEYVDGIDAASLVRRMKKQRRLLPLPIACHIVTSACLALDHAHRATDEHGEPMRLVHHDVSPHNLLIDRDGNVKLADFGVAHVRRHRVQRDELVGKIGYVAPEQLRHEPLDQRVDVFAAGIVLFELVTGQHPFSAASDFLTLRAIELGRFLPPETLREDCPPALALVIERALAPEPAGRYASAAELAEAIQRVYPLDSRHAAELGALARSTDQVPAPAATLTLPTARG